MNGQKLVKAMLEKELTKDEFKTLTFEHHTKHSAVIFMVGNSTIKYFVPRTPSDHRALLNCRAELRRKIRTARG